MLSEQIHFSHPMLHKSSIHTEVMSDHTRVQPSPSSQLRKTSFRFEIYSSGSPRRVALSVEGVLPLSFLYLVKIGYNEFVVHEVLS